MSILIQSIDHIVMTVANIEETCNFYQQVLGMAVHTFKGGRKALHFGQQKINLHQKGHEFLPNAKQATVGAIDICFIANTPIDKVITHLNNLNISIEEGPVERTGAHGPLSSIYIRDPDSNLVEIANYKEKG